VLPCRDQDGYDRNLVKQPLLAQRLVRWRRRVEYVGARIQNPSSHDVPAY